MWWDLTWSTTFTALVVLAIFISIGMMLGASKSLRLPVIAFVFGIIYLYYIESTNFSEYIMTPAWETIMGTRSPSVFDWGATFFLLSIIFVFIVALYNSFTSYYRQGVVRLWI